MVVQILASVTYYFIPCDNVVVDAFKLILLILKNLSIVKKVVNKIDRVK